MTIERRTLPLNFFDFLVVLIVGLLAVSELKKVEQAEAGIPPKAEFLIEVVWPDRAKSDIDTWFRAPTGETIYFSNKQAGLYSLDRDDLGQSNDMARQPDGSVKVVYINREILTMRGWVPGTYTVNLHVYAWRDPEPYEVTVRVLRLNPFRIVLERHVEVKMVGQQITVASFTLDAAGTAVAINYNPVNLTGGRP